jgi:hypothetical protein
VLGPARGSLSPPVTTSPVTTNLAVSSSILQ